MSLLLHIVGGGGPTNYADDGLVGSYVYTGQSATDSIARLDDGSFGAYTYTGQSATDSIARSDDGSFGAYTYSGQSATDSIARLDDGGFGAYAYTGQTGTDSIARSDDGSFGAYVYTGQTGTDSIARNDDGSFGAYAYTGQDAEDSVITTTEEVTVTGGKGDNERGKRLIIKPTGLGVKRRLQKPAKSDIITERLQEQEQIAAQFAEQVSKPEPIEQLSLAEIDFEIGTLLRKKLKTKEENERITMLLILLAANI